jgi:hypothetical protein
VGDSYGIGPPAHHDGLGVTNPAGAGSGIAVVTDGNVTGKLTQRLFVEYLGDQAHFGEDLDTPTVGGSNPSTFLATVLQGEKSEESKTGYILTRGVNTEHAARFVQIFMPLCPQFRFHYTLTRRTRSIQKLICSKLNRNPIPLWSPFPGEGGIIFSERLRLSKTHRPHFTLDFLSLGRRNYLA